MTKRFERPVLSAIYMALVFVMASPLTLAHGQATPLRDMAERLKTRVRGKAKHVRVIARVVSPSGAFKSTTDMQGRRQQLMNMVSLVGGSAPVALRDLPLVAVTVTPEALDAMVNSGLIDEVSEDLRLKPSLVHTIPLIGADETTNAGLISSDRIIAILDSGIDRDHPSLNVTSEYCFSTNDPATGSSSLCPGQAASASGVGSADACVGRAAGITGCSHGTHVAGIAAGEACTAANCMPSNGVAPGAPLMAFNINSRYDDNVAAGITPCSSFGLWSPCLLINSSDVISALGTVWDLELQDGADFGAVNMSFGFPGVLPGNCDAFNPAMTNMVNETSVFVPVVIASGNDSGVSGTSWPSCITSAVSVGATTKSDVIYSMSNMSSTVDLLAPGDNVQSAAPIGWNGGGGFVLGSGTSQAAPHVAGAFAIFDQIASSIPFSQRLAVMQATGVPIADTRSGGTITKPRIDIAAAARMLSREQVAPEVGAAYGAALGVTDLNGDGIRDLIVGVPYKNVGGFDNAGAVNVYYGSDQGPGILQVWTQNTPGIYDGAEANDYFGMAIQTGDFNDDGFGDIAIGVPYEDINGQVDAGAVNVIYGSARGLTRTGNQLWHQDSTNIEGAAEAGDYFGSTFAAADFDDDGVNDLAIGARGEDIGVGGVDQIQAGAVNVIYGSTSGLTSTDDQIWHQEIAGIVNTAKSGDYFGYALGVGDFDGDGKRDLAISVIGEDVGSGADGGAVAIIRGSNSGLTSTGNMIVSQDTPGVPDVSENYDYFGYALKGGDLNKDGYSDLVVGVPMEDLNSPVAADSGGINILYGSSSGLTGTGSQYLRQGASSVVDTAEAGDNFGFALYLNDFNADGNLDLIVGAPAENASAHADDGSITLLKGTATGITGTGSTMWYHYLFFMDGTATANARLGNVLAGGDLDGDGDFDLVAGAPFYTHSGASNAGAVNVILSAGSTGLSLVGNTLITE